MLTKSLDVKGSTLNAKMGAVVSPQPLTLLLATHYPLHSSLT
ncbi:hypothetical protein OCK74_13305 [Chitinophagaceae bacterium LB-8]|uniref:Uncharacterized protein n=1 Tax=Paraflavisolibacter caeni TaxID=2982496 RepID=A0A9X2XW19_9BACT|nr:hypothetical protein [Paraflavisolibacter caeni]MCU7550095.1 hypothetical protein [Paraflavisolibacter caeni]